MEDPIRTDLHCHACQGTFVAELDMALTGNHEIPCPNCGHIHYRVIESGRVTGDRYRSSMQTYAVTTSNVTMTTDTTFTTSPFYALWTDSTADSTQ